MIRYKAINSPLACISATLIVFFVIIGIIFSITFFLGRLQNVTEYKRDFLAIYVLSKAIKCGDPISTPINTLANLYNINTNYSDYPHATPHPPTMGLIFAPLTFFSYQKASIAFYFLQHLFLFLSAVELCKTFLCKSINTPYNTIPLCFSAYLITLGAYPILNDMLWGNVSIIILFLLSHTLFALSRNKPIEAGISLGISLLVKQITWPIFLALIVQKKYKAFISASATYAFGAIITLTLIGASETKRYLFSTLPNIVSIYETEPWNISLYTLSTRCFIGLDASMSYNFLINSPPAFYSPALYSATYFLIPIMLYTYFAFAVTRTNNLYRWFSISVCFCIIASPIAWEYYNTLMALPLFYMFTYKEYNHNPIKYAIGFLAIFYFIPLNVWLKILTGINFSGIAKTTTIHWSQSILLCLPSIITLILLIIITHTVDNSRDPLLS